MTHPSGSAASVVPLAGDTAVAQSILNIHIPGPAGRCQVCRVKHPCREFDEAERVMGTTTVGAVEIWSAQRGNRPPTRRRNGHIWWPLIIGVSGSIFLSLVIAIYSGWLIPVLSGLLR
jgi:hypothetical protein